MGTRSWLRGSKLRDGAGSGPARRVLVPRLEGLDDRIVPAQAIWTGNAISGNWSAAANWYKSTDMTKAPYVPQTGDELFFTGAATGTKSANNDFGAAKSFSDIVIQDPAYNLRGNPVTLTGTPGGVAVTADYTSATTGATINLTVNLQGTAGQIQAVQSGTVLTFQPTVGAAAITLSGTPVAFVGGLGSTPSINVSGPITGTGGLVIGGPNSSPTVTLNPIGSQNNFTGGTTVRAGVLNLNGPFGGNATLPADATITIGDPNLSSQSAAITLNGGQQIAPTANIVVNGTGTLNLGFNQQTIGGLTLNTQSGFGGGNVMGSGTLIFSTGANLTVTPGGGNTPMINPGIRLLDGAHTFAVGSAGGGGFGNTADLLLKGSLAGTGTSQLIKTDAGTLEIDAVGSFNSPTAIVVADGKLNLNATTAGAFGAITGPLTIGDGSGQQATVAELQNDQISDFTVVNFGPAGTLDLSALRSIVTTTTGTTTSAGDTIGGLSGASATSVVNFGTSGFGFTAATLIINAQGNESFAGNITGDGTIRVGFGGQGAVQTLTGQASLTGAGGGGRYAIQVNGGVLEFDGLATGGGGGISVSAGSTLYGTGTVQNLKLAGGTISPGTAPVSSNGTGAASLGTPGLFTVQQAFDASGGGTVVVRIADPSTFGAISVGQSTRLTAPSTTGGGTTNTAALPTLQVQLQNAVVPTGGVFDILRPGTQTGQGLQQGDTFFFLPEGGVVRDTTGRTVFQITYRGGPQATDVVLIDTDAPSATVQLDSGQANPTSGPTASFVATFSGPVQALLASGVNVVTTGSLSYSNATVTPIANAAGVNDGTTYRITVTGLNGTGNLNVSLSQGATSSLAQTPTQPSGTVTLVVNGATGAGNGNGNGTSPPVSPPPPPPSLVAPPSARLLVGTDAGGGGQLAVFQGKTAPTQQSVFGGPGYAGGVRVATGDFTKDGVPDEVVATGPGGPTQVQVLDGQTGAVLANLFPFESTFTGGVNVSVGDVTGDGIPDLIVSPDQGGGPRVIVYSGANFQVVANFFAIDDVNFRGGVRTAVGDLNKDGVGDLVVAAGYGGGPRIAIYDGKSVTTGKPQRLTADFFAFESTLRNGAYVTVADVDGDGHADVVVGGGPGGGPRVTVYSGAGLVTGNTIPIGNFFAGDPNARGGIRLGTANYAGDGTPDVVTGSGQGDGSAVRVYAPGVLTQSNPSPLVAFDAFPGYTGGVYVG